MPRMDGTGPENQGKQTGRNLGHCSNLTKEEALEKLGKGLGLRRKSGGGDGQARRLKSGLK